MNAHVEEKQLVENRFAVHSFFPMHGSQKRYRNGRLANTGRTVSGVVSTAAVRFFANKNATGSEQHNTPISTVHRAIS
jgi:hypothetical protein